MAIFIFGVRLRIIGIELKSDSLRKGKLGVAGIGELKMLGILKMSCLSMFRHHLQQSTIRHRGCCRCEAVSYMWNLETSSESFSDSSDKSDAETLISLLFSFTSVDLVLTWLTPSDIDMVN